MTVRLTIAALCLAACGRERFHYRLHEHETAPQIVFTNETVRLTLFVTTPGEAARDTSNPSTLSCNVVAPSGARVACPATPWVRPSVDEDNGIAKLSFTPTESGWHDVSATVPEGGEFRWHLYASTKRGEVVTQLPQSCRWLEAFPDGAWLCDGVFLREGEPAQPLNATLTAAAGAFIWTFSGGTLSRIPEPLAGTQLGAPNPTLETGLVDVRELLATPEDVLLVHSGGVVRVELDAAGGLRQAAALERNVPEEAIVRRLGTKLMVATSLVPFVLGGDPSQAVDQQSEVCLFSLDGLVQDACRRYPGMVRGRIDDGVLLVSANELRAVTIALDDGVQLELPSSLPTVPFTVRGLAKLSAIILPRLTDGALVLEFWPSGVTAASEQLVWAAGSTSTSVMSR